jgi:hypothetical protein
MTEHKDHHSDLVHQARDVARTTLFEAVNRQLPSEEFLKLLNEKSIPVIEAFPGKEEEILHVQETLLVSFAEGKVWEEHHEHHRHAKIYLESYPARETVNEYQI